MPASSTAHTNGATTETTVTNGSTPVRDAAKVVISKASELPGVTTATNIVKDYIPGVVSQKSQQYGEPALDIADEQVLKALRTLNLLREKQQVVQKQWFDQVDAVIKNNSTLSTGVDSVNTIVNKLNEQYLAATQAGKSFDREEFISGVRQRVGGLWSDNLRPLVASYYDRASEAIGSAKSSATEGSSSSENGSNSPRATQKILDGVRATLGSDWEKRVEGAVEQVRHSASTVYGAALSQYVQLLNKADGQRASLQTFLSGVKDNLGGVYNDRLEPLLKEFYERASSFSVPDLHQIYASVDADQNGEISLSDLVDTTRSAIGAINAQVSNVKNTVLKTSTNAVDYVIPPVTSSSSSSSTEASSEPESYSVRGLVGHVTQRVTDHVNSRVDAVNTAVTDHVTHRYEQAKDISSNTIQPRVGVDPVAIVENIYNTITGKVKQTQDTAQQTANATVEQVKQNLLDLQAKLEEAAKAAAHRTGVDTVPDRVKEARSGATEVVSTQANKLGVQKRIADLQASVKQALDALSQLTSETGEFVLHRQLTRLPADVFYFLTHTPALLLNFIFASASSPKDAATSEQHAKSDKELEALLHQVEQVLVALKNLFLLTPTVAKAAANEVHQAAEGNTTVKQIKKQVHHTLPKQVPFASSTRVNPTVSNEPKSESKAESKTETSTPSSASSSSSKPASSTTTTTTAPAADVKVDGIPLDKLVFEGAESHSKKHNHKKH